MIQLNFILQYLLMSLKHFLGLVILFGSVTIAVAYLASLLGGSLLQVVLSVGGIFGAPSTALFSIGALFPFVNSYVSRRKFVVIFFFNSINQDIGFSVFLPNENTAFLLKNKQTLLKQVFFLMSYTQNPSRLKINLRRLKIKIIKTNKLRFTNIPQ